MSEDIQSRLARLTPEKRALLQRRLSERGTGAASDSLIPHREGTVAPLSPAQQQVWVTIAMAGGETAYHMSRLLRMRGRLDHTALVAALNLVVERHAIYRTVISEQDGHAHQEIRPTVAMTVATAALEEAWHDQVRALILRPFMHGQEPLLRISVLSSPADEHLLVLVIHHLITDGMSVDLLLAELAAAYQQTLTLGVAAMGTVTPIAPVQALPTYADVSHWMREREQSGAFADDLAYWTKRLAGRLPVLALPGDHPRPPRSSGRGFFLTCVVPPDLVQAVATFAKARGATAFMVMLAVYQVLLHRLSGQSDLLVGTPVAGRQRIELEKVHGFLVSTVVIRAGLSDDPTFETVLTQAKAAAVEALQHQDAPFESVVTALKPERMMGVHPVFQTLFSVVNATDAPRWSGLQTTREQLDPGTAMFDLLLEIASEDGGQVCYWEANSDLFEPATVRAWMDHYVTLLRSALAAATIPISTLPLLARGERTRVLHDFNRTTMRWEGAQVVHRLVEEQAQRTPDAVAVLQSGRELTYRVLDQRANHLARVLHQRGVEPGGRVAICVDRSFEMLVAVLGVLKAGCAYVPLDPTYPLARRIFMLADAKVGALIAQRRLAADLGTTVLVINAEGEDLRLEATAAPALTDRPGQSAYIIYTSGSTGQPKGIDMPHEPLANLIHWQLATSRHGAGRTLQFSPLGFDVSFQEIFSTWAAGGTLVLIDDQVRRDPDQLLQHLQQQRIDRLFLPFVALQQLAEAADRHHGTITLREMITAGEQLQITPALVAWFTRMPLCTLHNHYGPSETHVVTCHDLSGDPRSWPALPPIGKPIANARCYILDRHQQPVPVGVTGELHLGGAVLAKGYFGRDELTSARFVSDPFFPQERMYRTGDLARWQADGVIEFLGRADDQVKIRGFRIELGEIENALGRHAAIHQQVVTAPGEGADRRLVAYLVAKPGQTLDHGEIRAFLRQQLPEYMVPAVYVDLTALPTTPSGKIDRQALPAASAAQPLEDARQVPPPVVSLSLHYQLIQLWEEVLNLRGVRLDDDFFAIGGNSLLAYRMITSLEQHIGRRLPMAALFNNPTILGLCEVILSDSSVLDRPVLKVQSGDASVRPLFFLHGDYLGGGYYCVSLARRLGPEVPFYALVPKRIDLTQPIPTIEELATFYVHEIRAIAPVGPYLLGGFCIGGMIAYEVARQLREQGEEIALLALVDSVSTYPPERLTRRLTQGAALMTRMSPDRQLALFTRLNQRMDRMRELSLLGLITVALTKVGLRKPAANDVRVPSTLTGSVVISTKAAQDQMTAYVWAASAYVPKPISSNAHLMVSDEFAATDPDHTFGWSTRTRDLQLYRMRGSHLESITVNLQALADLLRPLILAANQVPTADARPATNALIG